MLWHIFAFELRKRLKSPFIYLMALVFSGVMFLLILLAGGAFEGSAASTGDREFANSAYTLHQLSGAVYLFLMIVVAAVFGQAVFQDYKQRTYQLFFTKPISKTAYLGGRLLAAWAVCMLIAAATAPAAMLAAATPWVDASLFGPHHSSYYLMPLVTLAAPNIMIIGSFFFALAVLTRKIFPVYMGAAILVVGYLMSETLLIDMENQNISSMLDPFGGMASATVARYWSVVEKNTLVMPLEGVLLYNRIVWGALGLIVLAFTWVRFRFAHAGAGDSKKGAVKKEGAVKPEGGLIPVKPSFTNTYHWSSYLTLTRLQLRETIKNVYFLVILVFGVLLMITTSSVAGSVFGTEAYPVTYRILEFIGGSFMIFMLILITFVSGELMWRERDNDIDQISDALPVSDGIQLAAKLTTMLGVSAVLMATVGATGIMIQLSQGYTNLELAQYMTTLFGFNLYDYFVWCVLAVFIHVLANNKFAGHGLMVLYYAVIFFILGPLGLEHRLFSVANMPGVTYSDMNSYGHYSAEFLRYAVCWGGFCLMLAAASRLFWMRGKETRWSKRMALARQRFTSPVRALSGVGALLFTGMGAFILYNTTVLNTYRTSNDNEKLQAAYEKTYREMKDLPTPDITDVSVEVDIFPAERRLSARGTFRLANKQDKPVTRFLLSLPPEVTMEQVLVDREMTLEERNDDYNQNIYALPAPLQPGETMTLDFRVSLDREGFPNQDNLSQVVFNGTFFDNSLLFPSIGYREDWELTGERTREKYDLPARPVMPPIDDLKAHNQIYIGGSQRVTFEAIVSTTPDQIAIAPGYLQREWTDKGRRYFHYKMDRPIWNFYSFMSADYLVKRDKWNDVNLEIYYHRGHEYNLDAMMDSMKASLAYFSENFSPYQHKQLRIIEFPRYRTFAQAFPNTVPFSEAIGFIAKVDPDDSDDLDYPYYVTAHEVAHQWWAHQVCGAYVQGATMLSESLSQYGALMVMRQRFGEARMKRFLRYELDSYLQGRSLENRREMPLAKNENQQYIHYNKGSLVFFALQDAIGEETLNGALAAFLDKWAFKGAPYPTSLDLLDEIKAVAAPEHHALIDDLFLHITLWDHRALEAEAEPVGGGENYQVTLKISAAKKRSDEVGNLEEVTVGDMVDVGVFDEDEKPLYLAEHRVDQPEQTITVKVAGKPARAAIDPLHKFIDRDPRDNFTRVNLKDKP
ncbi:MAG: M1 family aminopeptidase [Acidobacteriota bacterium]|nr:M1 family aminopeptidase [Acidobacteriota bacterium]